jgi:hypothetical protein
MAINKTRDRLGRGKNENRPENSKRSNNPTVSYEKNEDRYEGYDEERTSFDPNYQNDYDIKEENDNAGAEYRNDYDNRIKGVSSNRSSELRQAFDRGIGDNDLTTDKRIDKATTKNKKSKRQPVRTSPGFRSVSGRKGFGGGRRRENDPGR